MGTFLGDLLHGAYVDPHEKGAFCDGVHDDYDALNKAVTEAAATNTAVLISGPMRLATGISIPVNVPVVFASNGCILLDNDGLTFRMYGDFSAGLHPIFIGYGSYGFSPTPSGQERERWAIWYGVSGTGHASTTGSINATDNHLTVADASTFLVGHYVAVVGAGAAGVLFVSCIKGISGSVLTLADNAATSVSGAAVYHEDSKPLQKCIDGMSNGGIIQCSSGRHNFAYNVYIGVGDRVSGTGQQSIKMLGIGSGITEWYKPTWALQKDYILSIDGYWHQLKSIVMHGDPDGTTASGWSTEKGLWIRGAPSIGAGGLSLNSVRGLELDDIRIERAGVGLQLGNYNVDACDDDIETNSIHQVWISSCNVGYFENGQNILHNPLKSCWFFGCRDHLILQQRGSEIALTDCYLGGLYDYLTSTIPPATNTKIRVEGGHLLLKACRSEFAGTVDHIIVSLISPDLGRSSLENCVLTTYSNDSLAVYCGNTGGLGGITLVDNEIGGVVEFDGTSVVSIGNRYGGTNGTYPDTVNGVYRTASQKGAAGGIHEFYADNGVVGYRPSIVGLDVLKNKGIRSYSESTGAGNIIYGLDFYTNDGMQWAGIDNFICGDSAPGSEHSQLAILTRKSGALTTGYLDSSSFTAATQKTLSLIGSASDGASAVGVILDNNVTLSTAGAKIVSVRNNSVERLYVGLNGTGVQFWVGNSSTDNLTLGGNPRFYLKTPTGINGLRFDSDTQPFQISALDSGGGGTLTGSDWSLSGTVGDGTQRLQCQAANATAGSTMKDTPMWYLTAKYWNGSASATAFQGFVVGEVYSTLAPRGGLLLGTTGSPYGCYYVRNDGLVGIGVKGASLVAGLHFQTNVADSASAIALLVDTSAVWSTAGAKLQSWKNNGTEKAYISFDGSSYFASHVISGGSFLMPSGGGLLANGTYAAKVSGQDLSDGSGIGVILDNSVSLTTSGDKITSFRNANSEKMFVDMDGAIGLVGTTAGASVTAGIFRDASNNLSFKDGVAGTKTLTQLASGAGTATATTLVLGIIKTSTVPADLNNPYAVVADVQGGNAVVAGLVNSVSNATITIKGNRSAADAGTDVIVDTTVTRTNGSVFKINNNGSTIFSLETQGTLSLFDVIWLHANSDIYAANANTGISLNGYRNAGDAGADVVLNSRNTRTAGTLLDVQNNTASKFSVAYNGALTTVANALARSSLPAVGQQVSASCGEFSSSSGTYVDITNLSVTITTTGRPVMLFLINDGSGSTNSGKLGAFDITSNTKAGGRFALYRDSTLISQVDVYAEFTGTTTASISVPSSSLMHLDTPSAGTYTYKLQGKLQAGDYFLCYYSKLVAYEL